MKSYFGSGSSKNESWGTILTVKNQWQFIVDFYCKALALAIEVDGSVHNTPDAQMRDQARQARLEALGVRFLRFSDDAVNQDINGVCLTIIDWIKQSQD